MKTLTIFDPAMCCSTGICGADIDQKLVDFAADLDWLKSEGIEVKRINLSQEPALFAENEQVKSILEKSGVEGLPVILADDEMQSFGQYPDRVKLAHMAGVTAAQTVDQASASATGCCGQDNDAEKSSSSCC
ncbi:MAG: arsenite efflux transporter metallochaperone ArsD [bacterium]|nr:arsenite efflux transporter metallochaperone ArsD [Gammaproteobacteria bacterium]MCP4933242.1 arsenite efflux transporter metallochaperone ArsD [bacterium]